jgi:hypothetical protein
VKATSSLGAVGSVNATSPLGAVGNVKATSPLGAVGNVNATSPFGAVGRVNVTSPLGAVGSVKTSSSLGAVGKVKANPSLSVLGNLKNIAFIALSPVIRCTDSEDAFCVGALLDVSELTAFCGTNAGCFGPSQIQSCVLYRFRLADSPRGSMACVGGATPG